MTNKPTPLASVAAAARALNDAFAAPPVPWWRKAARSVRFHAAALAIAGVLWYVFGSFVQWEWLPLDPSEWAEGERRGLLIGAGVVCFFVTAYRDITKASTPTA